MIAPAPLPLSGTTVLSLEQAVAAPFATRQLADLGARVIKVERPGDGDFARRYDESVHGESSYFVWLNRTKESLSLDVKTESGRDILEHLLARADVLVQNLGPGAATRLGLDADAVALRHPRVIVCDISGYGSTGTLADRKAYDLLIQAETGLVSLTGTPEAAAKVGISVADIAAGMYAYSGILTALLHRDRTGQAAPVQISLFDALTEWMGSPLYYASYSGNEPPRAGAEHATIAPYGPFSTSDGTVLLAVQNEREWLRLCDIALGDPAIATDERFRTNSRRVAHRAECNALLTERLSTVDTASALTLLDKAGIANGRMNSVAALPDHPALTERDRWRTVDSPGGPIRAMVPPATLAGVPTAFGPVPRVGDHTHAILTELGYDTDRIQRLRDDHVI